MVWPVADAGFQENLAAARVYNEQHWTLCAPRTAVALDRPLGTWLANLRRPGALEGHPERAAALAKIDQDWNPAWPAEWQRHYAAVRELLRDEQDTEILPGTTVHGLDVGRWAARHQEDTVWHRLMDGQRERLERLGFAPRPAKPEAAVKAPKGGSDAFERGLRSGPVSGPYRFRDGPPRPRGNRAGRRCRALREVGGISLEQSSRRGKLTAERLAALAALDLGRAQ
ncbi:helicase associated domain-containing protein [Streptomyces sp. NPDC054950]